MSHQISIACLPVAGRDNPYQYLMIDGLNKSEHIHAYNGVDNKFIGIIRTVFKYKPNYIHFDWITSYYLRRKLWMTLLLLPLFYFQIYFVIFFTKTKIVWTLHNIVPHNVEHLWLHRKVRCFFGSKCEWIRVFSKLSINKATKELNVTEKKLIIVPEGDYVNVYENKITRDEARNYLKIQNSKTVLLYLGFIKPYKGLENLINEFSKIKNNELELIIAGRNMNNDYLKYLKKLILDNKETRIRLKAEFIPIEKLQIYYNAANIVVLPFNKVENSGSVIMAMGFKKAILAPKIGVLIERLSNQSSLLYDDLFTGLNEICHLEKNKLEIIGNQNFEALKQYNWEDFNRKFIK